MTGNINAQLQLQAETEEARLLGVRGRRPAVVCINEVAGEHILRLRVQQPGLALQVPAAKQGHFHICTTAVALQTQLIQHIHANQGLHRR